MSSGTVNDLHINAAALGSNSSIAVDVKVLTSASSAKVTFTGTSITSATTIEVGGNAGVQQLSFASGTTVSAVATAVNAIADQTGVSAALVGGKVELDSRVQGSSQFVSVKAISGTFNTNKNRGTGKDASVSVNGAAATANGADVTYRNNSVDVSFTLNKTFNKPGSTSFNITGGGATFSLGSKVTYADQASIGIGSVTTGSLGAKELGYLNSLGSGGSNSLNSESLVNAQKIIDKSVAQVSQLRGRIGAFQKFTIGATISNLNVALENVQSSESAITDTNFATEPRT